MRLRFLTYLLLFFLTPNLSAQFSVDLDVDPEQSFLWNRFSSVAMIDNFAVVSIDDGLMLLKLDDATKTYTPIGQLKLPAPPTRYKKFDNLLVFESKVGLLYFVDISSLPDLLLLGTATFPSGYYDFAVHGSDLYISYGFDGLWRYQLNDYDNPTFVDSTMLGIHYTQIETEGNYLYALDDYNGVLRYDISGQSFGQFIDYLYAPFQVSKFVINDSLVTMSLIGKRQLLLGTFGKLSAHIDDTLGTLGIYEQMMAIDSFVVLFDPKIRLIDLLNRNDLTIDRRIHTPSLDGRYYGDLSDYSGEQQMLLPNLSGGLSRYNLSEIGLDVAADRAYRRTGPITGLVGINSNLLTAGIGNPLERFKFNAQDTAVADEVFFEGLKGVRALGKSDDHLFAYYAPLSAIMTFRIDGDSLNLAAKIPIETLTTFTMRIPERSPDGPQVIFNWFGSRLTISDAPDVNISVLSAEINVLGVISDVVKVDSMIVIATNKRTLYFYRLYDNFDVSFRAQIGSNLRIDHMRVLKSADCPDQLVAFAGTNLMQINTEPRTIPSVISTVPIPLPVNNSVVSGDHLYTVGDAGISLYSFADSCGTLTNVTFGGRGGHLLALVDKFLAVSDGTAIHLYRIDSGIFTDVGNISGSLPGNFQLVNYPNPFNPSTVIRYELPRGSDVTLVILNMLGQKVRTLEDKYVSAGIHTIEWNGLDDGGSQVATGIYLYQLTSNSIVETRKMLLLR